MGISFADGCESVKVEGAKVGEALCLDPPLARRCEMLGWGTRKRKPQEMGQPTVFGGIDGAGRTGVRVEG